MESGRRQVVKAYQRSDRSSATPAQILGRMGIFSKAEHTQCYNSLKDKSFLSQRLVDWNELRSIGDDGALAKAVLLFYSFDFWGKLFGCAELGYRELTLEFLSTFDWGTTTDNRCLPTCSFQMMENVFTVTLPELAIHVGVYTDAEASRINFPLLCIDFPEGVTPRAAWNSLTGGTRSTSPAEPSRRRLSPRSEVYVAFA
ncbi:hypothetical protein KSP39_PZI009707 [Platanthera zijinensis]|uniref:Uncharacterized protein n=1 Tax=Platanthera zijinensis TaxID=2320716 RepID=A0AAP0BKY3_9ASPA